MTADPPNAAALSAARWRMLVLAVAGTTVGLAVFLAGVLLLVNRADWWRGYLAATVAAALAAGASLVPLAFGVRRGPGMLMVQMFMASAGVRGAVALGVSALAVGAGGYPALPTFALVVPYYLALLAVETACLARMAKSAGS